VELDHDTLVQRLGELAQAALPLWRLDEGASARLINLSENATYLVEAPSGQRSVMRVHREDYHTGNAIACELAWMKALREEGGVVTPAPVPARDGTVIQTVQGEGLPRPRHIVMFEFVEGHEPDESHDLVEPFRELGEIAARCNVHAIGWRRPANFERLDWDFEHIIGAHANWGDWRAAPAMDAPARALLERQEAVIRNRLETYGKGPDRFGLIHADMRLANLLVDENGTRLIDFDDCGLGWFMYDFGTGVSFIEDHPQLDDMMESWLDGYARVRRVTRADRDEMHTFVMLRRMALLAWIGSHGETDLAQQQGPAFTRVSCELAEKYLSAHG
jgi:Ser/Thr protein kinase RdoA (MazF antagonist)